jgi:DNA-binding winged helix-turn-helix (wHTH) protein/formylglycine-generating enzyme required for sulfatase activity/dienelactone hydrolase
VICFGRYRFDADTAQLWDGDREVRLTPKAAAVLRMLVTQAGVVVTKARLFETVWPDTAVSDDALTSCIQELRRALGDNSRQPQFIETRHRRGFRFIAALGPITPPAVEAASVPERPQSVEAEPGAVQPLSPEHPIRIGPAWLGPVAAGVAVLALVAAAATLWWQPSREAELRWLRDEAIPEIGRLATSGDPVAAYRLAHRALAMRSDDAALVSAWDAATWDIPVTTEPPGAVVSIRAVHGQGEGWIELGRTPLTAKVPLGQMRWRFALEGHQAREVIPNPYPETLVLSPAAATPPGMVHVTAGDVEVPSERRSVALPEFWIGATEVTNREFKGFVDAGGYRTRGYWSQPLLDDGRPVPWDKAMARFRDTTARPGPATWEAGTFAAGTADHPVHGISWYEAAAYAAWSGCSLPTIHHWRRAAGVGGIFSDVLSISNFGSTGPVPVGTTGSLGPFGAGDMAGNVKEWVWNETSGGLRFVLGGAWFEATYTFNDEDARQPFEREAGFGFRCMRQRSPVAAALAAPVVALAPDPAALVPVSDDVYRGYRRLYDYDPRPLDARLEDRDDSQAQWITERVSFTAAYGHDRVPLMLLLPRGGTPPYQVVIYFPGSDAASARSSRGAFTQLLQFLVTSGRAVAYPVYQQTYERLQTPTGPNFVREISIQRGQDLRRTIDYLETRPDIDAGKTAFYGLSLGAQLGPVYLAIEPRLRTGVLFGGGFETWTVPAETDPVHFAPRVRQPVLMVSGRDDFDLPYESAQVPLFKALGTPAADKRHAVLPGGHIPPRLNDVFKEILDWLDRYLGPVR